MVWWGRGLSPPFGAYQQVWMPAFLPPWMSLVRESPTMRTSSFATGPMAAKTTSKKAMSGFSAPIFYERKMPSMSRSRPERRSFAVWAWTVPLETTYCRTRPRRDATSATLSSRGMAVSPSRAW